MRAERIGDSCEQCGSTDSPFVIQHFSHDRPKPPSKRTVVWNLMREYGSYPQPPTVRRPGCPLCQRASLTERTRKKPKWRCIACEHEFDDPVTVELRVSGTTGKDEYARYRQGLSEAFDDFHVAHADEVEQRYRAVLADYEQERQASYETYISGEGTATFCKTCAYQWDLEGKRLCGQCKTHYHPFKYRTCYECLPSSRKEESRDAREEVERLDAEMKSLEDALEEASEEEANEGLI